MSRNFCDIKRDEYYTGAELGRRLEIRLDKEGIKHRQYFKGEMVRLLHEAGIQSVDGKWLGIFAIPVMKAEFERVKNNPKKRKAKPTGKQTSQNKTKDANKVVGSTLSSLPHQLLVEGITIPDIPVPSFPDFSAFKEKLIEAVDLFIKNLEETLGGKING